MGKFFDMYVAINRLKVVFTGQKRNKLITGVNCLVLLSTESGVLDYALKNALSNWKLTAESLIRYLCVDKLGRRRAAFSLSL